MRPLKACLALILAAFALTGCIKVEMAVAISDDDMVSGSLIFGIEKAVLEQDKSGKAPAQIVNDAVAQIGAIPPSQRTEVYEDSKYLGRRFIFDRVPLAEFSRKDGSGPQIVHSGGLYTFTMNGDTATMDLGPTLQFYDLLNAAEFRISITFPGRVIERDNLATLSGNTVSWRVKLSSKHQFKAVSEEPVGFPWLLVGGVAAIFGILIIIGIVVLVIRVNRRPKPVAPPMPAPAVQHVD
ncbi:hypothetical protein Rhe02_62020 [Rhizocola hellebori]|uniref:LppM domain-containing protein n=1 Tax=Rhizocola hellebori TaxID=1392758 RepID=A0A8J3QEI4_9ACTN|nr:hypothetical protein [Rhizocola hellebori]GIH08135.1 hypothetical protein Rhe02_62020 [Rhizocola hellebori]